MPDEAHGEICFRVQKPGIPYSRRKENERTSSDFGTGEDDADIAIDLGSTNRVAFTFERHNAFGALGQLLALDDVMPMVVAGAFCNAI